jgi:hypothetical protein
MRRGRRNSNNSSHPLPYLELSGPVSRAAALHSQRTALSQLSPVSPELGSRPPLAYFALQFEIGVRV